VVDERVENELPDAGHTKPYFYFGYENGRPMINVAADGDSGTRRHRELRRETIDPEQSVLSQRKDPDLYPEITHVGDLFSRISTYRDWRLGRYTPPRLPQPVDAPNDALTEDASNLGLVVNRIKSDPATRDALDGYMSEFLPDYEYVETLIEGGTVQIFISEKGRLIPATRLSDGTLRWLALLAVLLNPTPPPLVCIEEPELDLHPDVIPVLAQLLRTAANRMQLVVTTHSDDLASEFSDAPTAVIVCEKHAGESHFARLEAERLEPWLAKYRLGQLRQMGEIGGNRY
jgi:predicted ATPase